MQNYVEIDHREEIILEVSKDMITQIKKEEINVIMIENTEKIKEILEKIEENKVQMLNFFEAKEVRINEMNKTTMDYQSRDRYEHDRCNNGRRGFNNFKVIQLIKNINNRKEEEKGDEGKVGGVKKKRKQLDTNDNNNNLERNNSSNNNKKLKKRKKRKR